MPQAKLPDINNAWVRYRNYGIESIDSQNYSGAVAAIYEMISLFPEKYRVEINTDRYEDLEKDTIIYICGECTAETNLNAVTVFNLTLGLTLAFVSGLESTKVWDCVKCQTRNMLENTQIIRSQEQKPHYHKVIPEPPNRKQGIMDRNAYDNKMRIWFFKALEEVDHQLGKYRDEYKPIDEDEELETLEGGEENDN